MWNRTFPETENPANAGFLFFRDRPLPVYFVEKLGIRMKLMVAASHLARDDLLDVPSSVQMMGFVG